MIKNGKPYTNEHESGFVDDELISTIRLTMHEKLLIKLWISDNIKPSKRILNMTSYGLKHKLEHDTGIYLTNNAFKDAMLIEGYEPINPNELNWDYKIILKKDRTKYKLSDAYNNTGSTINQSNINSDSSTINVNPVLSQGDDLMQEFINEFSTLKFGDKVKVINYVSELKGK